MSAHSRTPLFVIPLGHFDWWSLIITFSNFLTELSSTLRITYADKYTHALTQSPIEFVWLEP